MSILLNFYSGTAATGNWNQDSSIFSTGLKVADMIDDAGLSTGISWTCNTNASAKGGHGILAVPTGAASWIDQSIISDQCFSVNASTVADYTLSGLTGGAYTIEVYSSYDSADGANGTAILEVSADNFSTLASVDGFDNSSSVATLSNIAPSSNSITLKFRRGAASTDTNDRATINALRITEEAAGLTIDSTDASMQRNTDFQVVCSNPTTTPTTGNTTLTNGNDTLTPSSVTGSDPYTLTFPVGDLTKQVDATGYDWTLEITPDDQDGS